MTRVTLTEAARQLGVNKSTVSRWVAKHPALSDAEGHVSVEELRQHRDSVINPALQTRGIVAAGPHVGAPAAPPTPAGPSLNDRRSKTEEIKGLTAELELAEKLRLTVPRGEVETAIFDAVELMKSKGAQLARDRAEKIARLEDVRSVERALEDFVRDLFGVVARELRKATDDGAAAHAA